MSEHVSLTDARLLEIRQLDENDSSTLLITAVGDLLDEVGDLRSACSKWREIFCSFPHDAQQALRELRERLREIELTALPLTRNSRETNRRKYLELRAGIEAVLADPPGGDLESNHEWLKPLRKLLKDVS